MSTGDDDISIPEEISELPLSDNDLPPEEMPAADGEPELEHKEFLISQNDEHGGELLSELPSDGAPAPVASVDDEVTAASDVDQMLSAELLPEGLEFLPEAGSALPQLPTFQLHLRGLTDSTRVALKKALDGQGAAVPEQAWAAGAPVISQLSEYQVIVLLQTARSLGVAASASVEVPDQAPTEDDLALGDLSLVPDPESSSSSTESAPSVTLPKGEKEVMLCTPDQMPGCTVRESFGLVMAHRSIARRIFREEEVRDKLQKELRSVPGRNAAALPSSHLQIVLRDLMLDLRKAALAQGANAVLGVKLESFPESGMSDPQLEQLRLVAFGTAAVVDKS